jgi:hypothetical protein
MINRCSFMLYVSFYFLAILTPLIHAQTDPLPSWNDTAPRDRYSHSLRRLQRKVHPILLSFPLHVGIANATQRKAAPYCVFCTRANCA